MKDGVLDLRLLIDNALSPALARALALHGFDVVHVRDVSLASADDETILRHAAKEDRIVVSMDTDFGLILARHQLLRPSFILFRTAIKDPRYLLAVLLRNRAAIENDLKAGAIVVIEDTRIRVRALPIRAHAEQNHASNTS